ncbi:MAG: TonB-dependent receptor plug domain-containing protein [Xanthomonadaceae bacterium]|nr:TonB-dependent receptor plug domain-containing protein [Xanthomonadaceae bacterium]
MNNQPKRRRVQRDLLASAILATLAFGISPAVLAQDAQEEDASTTAQPATTLDKVTVTGSRIKRVDIEGPTPVTVVTAEDIQAQGFNTVYEALNTLTQNDIGRLQNELTAGSFTQGAQFVSLRGLGPSYQLVLINGDETERERAVTEGRALYAKYGDEAAQPRIAAVLRRERRQATGSRLGSTGNVQIFIPGPGGVQQIDGSTFYDPKYWDPEQYQAWHDSIWMAPRIGRVTVGEIEAVEAAVEGSPRIPRPEPQVDAEEPDTPVKDERGLGTTATPVPVP